MVICAARWAWAANGLSGRRRDLATRNELDSHYFRANLPQQFDEYIWFDNTRAVTPLDTAEVKGLPDTYPFGV